MGSRYGIVFVEIVTVEVNFGAEFVGKIIKKKWSTVCSSKNKSEEINLAVGNRKYVFNVKFVC